jgi:hypothetical protein
MAKRARYDHRLSKQQIIIGVCVALAAAALLPFGSLVLRAHELDVQAAAYQKEIQQLAEQNRELQKRLEFVRSDEYVRSVAPDILLWGDPNATYVMPVEGTPDPTPGAKTP